MLRPDVPIYAVLDADVAFGYGAEVAIAELDVWIPEIAVARQTSLAATCQALRRCVMAINARVYAEALRPETRGCGTTLTCCTVVDRTVVGAHVGDSRVYLRQDGAWERLTRDHTLVEKLRETGSPEELADAFQYHRNVITAGIGFAPTVEPQHFNASFNPGDCVLLCTDGAWSLFDPGLTGAGPDGPQDLEALLRWAADRHAAQGGLAPATMVLVQL